MTGDQPIQAGLDGGPVSPELALVDPVLAAHARARLAEPDDTLALVETLVEASRRSSLALRALELPTRPPAVPVVASSSAQSLAGRSRKRPLRSAVYGGAAAAVVLVVALLVGVRVDLRGTQADADSTTIVVPVTTTPPIASSVPKPASPTKPTSPTKPLKPRTEPQPGAGQGPRVGPVSRRFAWAPVADASGYHIELFRGARKVFAADTAKPAVTIPARWTFAGRDRRLGPGDYRWYVWPLISGRRAGAAIVQAKLVVAR